MSLKVEKFSKSSPMAANYAELTLDTFKGFLYLFTILIIRIFFPTTITIQWRSVLMNSLSKLMISSFLANPSKQATFLRVLKHVEPTFQESHSLQVFSSKVLYGLVC